MVLEVLVYVISFISLYLVVFWINTLYLEEGSIHKNKPPKKYPFISIVVPAWNEEKTIAKTIKSLLKLDYPKNKLEILVVANGCTDNTAGVVRSFKSKKIKLIETPIPGKARAQNIGLKHAKGELVAITDADSIVKGNSLKLLVPHFEDPKMGVVFSSLKVEKPKNVLEKLQWFEYLSITLLRRVMSSLAVLFVAPGAFNLYRRKTILKLGGFDENTLTEDIEIATRLLHSGYKVESQLDSVTRVKVPKTPQAFHSQRVRWCRGFISTIIKYKDMLFNPKYGLLGTFIMPLSIILPILIIGIVVLALYTTSIKIYDFLFYLWIVRETLFQQLPAIQLKSWLLGTNALIVFPMIVMIACGAYLLVKSHKHLKVKLKYPFTVVIFFIAYQFLLSIYWLIALIYEAAGAKKTWRGEIRW